MNSSERGGKRDGGGMEGRDDGSRSELHALGPPVQVCSGGERCGVLVCCQVSFSGL
jgi:hypothetical protein